MNKYLKNWGNCEVLGMKLGGFPISCCHFFLFMEASLRCDVLACNFGI